MALMSTADINSFFTSIKFNVGATYFSVSEKLALKNEKMVEIELFIDCLEESILTMNETFHHSKSTNNSFKN